MVAALIRTGLVLLIFLRVDTNLRGEERVAIDSAFKAYNDYWSAFGTYHAKRAGDKDEFAARWNDAQTSTADQQNLLSDRKIEELSESLRQYRSYLGTHPNAIDCPQVLLSSAQVAHLLGKALVRKNPSLARNLQNEAIEAIETIESEFEGFERIGEALYVKALVQTWQKNRDDAFKTWRKLSSKGLSNLYGVHAFIALGDHAFRSDQAAKAYVHYSKALELLHRIDPQPSIAEEFRLQYRILWAGFRTGAFSAVIAAGKFLVQPSHQGLPYDEWHAYSADAVQILADTVFEERDAKRVIAFLGSLPMRDSSTAVGLRVMLSYQGAEQHEMAILVGEYLTKQFPMMREIPQILNLLSTSNAALKRPSKEVAALEEIAYMLPKDSVFRARFSDETALMVELDTLASHAAIRVADLYYERGEKTGTSADFVHAGVFYGLLAQNLAGDARSKGWRLRLGNCWFNTNHLADAAIEYESLKNARIEPTMMQEVMQQLVFTYERLWRKAYTNAAEKGENPLVDHGAAEYVGQLESAIDQYAAKYPNETKSVDLLLVGANTNRDMHDYSKAARFWQRVLLMQASSDQRSLAIRGIVFATIKGFGPGQTVVTIRNFLRLENWTLLGDSLKQELLGILSVSVNDEAKRLSDLGRLEESGFLMVRTAEEFAGLPNRSKLLRDGCYTFAVAGNWTEALAAAQWFKDHKFAPYQGDIAYLIGRGLEFQMRFAQAAKTYYDFTQSFPNHSRVQASLERALVLAKGEDSNALAGDIELSLARRAKNAPDRLRLLNQSVESYLKGRQFGRALASAELLLNASMTDKTQLSAKLLLAKVLIAAGSSDQGLADLDYVSKKANLHKTSFGIPTWRQIEGESQFLMAEEERRKFVEIEIEPSSFNKRDALDRKNKIFARLQTHYEKTIATQHAVLAAAARFQLAEASEILADDIANGFVGTGTGDNRFRERVTYLRTLAKKNYGDNVLIRPDAVDPAALVWVKRSLLHLSGYDPQNSEQRYEFVRPFAVHLDLPQRWSTQ